MDKIFKNRFENLEKKAPDHILDNILSQVAADASVSPVSNNALYYKLSIYAFLAVATVVSTLLLWPENNTPTSNDQVLLAELPIQTPVITGENEAVDVMPKVLTLEKADDSIEPVKSNIKKEIQAPNSSIQKPVFKKERKKNQPEILIHTDPKPKVDNITIEIIAPRSICSGECEIEIKNDHTGTWESDKNIFIQNPNSTKTLIKYNEAGKVLLTYICGNVRDTFSIYFHKPSQIAYTLTAQACGQKNGKIEFDFPENRVFTSSNHLSLINNSLEQLVVDNYDIELLDNYGCEYYYNVELPIENLVGEISHDALEYRVGFPVYFQSNIEISDAEYIWDFGDGQLSYDRKPEHRYEKPGAYDISLKLVKENCQETMRIEDVTILDKKLEGPNVFTPNGDGQNDLFYVSVPENVNKFECCILDKTGHLVYKWTQPEMGWDGLVMNGQKAEQGTYYYIIKGSDSANKAFEYKSCLELRR